MAEELYETPGDEPSQGDIFELLPHSFVEKPLLMLTREAGVETILRVSSEPLVGFNDKGGQQIVSVCKRQKGLLLTHDCEIDKAHVSRWLVCPVVPLVTLSPDTRDRVKRNRIYAMLYLPKYREALPESFVDFNQITTLSADLVRGTTRLVSLSDVGRKALYAQLIRCLTRWELRSLTCPSCQTNIDPSDILPVRTP